MTCEQAGPTPTTQETIETILNDPAASNWLKTSLQSALSRDAIDAANDAQNLAEALVARDLTNSCVNWPSPISNLKNDCKGWWAESPDC